jgi:hypothetical protein
MKTPLNKPPVPKIDLTEMRKLSSVSTNKSVTSARSSGYGAHATPRSIHQSLRSVTIPGRMDAGAIAKANETEIRARLDEMMKVIDTSGRKEEFDEKINHLQNLPGFNETRIDATRVAEAVSTPRSTAGLPSTTPRTSKLDVSARTIPVIEEWLELTKQLQILEKNKTRTPTTPVPTVNIEPVAMPEVPKKSLLPPAPKFNPNLFSTTEIDTGHDLHFSKKIDTIPASKTLEQTAHHAVKAMPQQPETSIIQPSPVAASPQVIPSTPIVNNEPKAIPITTQSKPIVSVKVLPRIVEQQRNVEARKIADFFVGKRGDRVNAKESAKIHNDIDKGPIKDHTLSAFVKLIEKDEKLLESIKDIPSEKLVKILTDASNQSQDKLGTDPQMLEKMFKNYVKFENLVAPIKRELDAAKITRDDSSITTGITSRSKVLGNNSLGI